MQRFKLCAEFGGRFPATLRSLAAVGLVLLVPGQLLSAQVLPYKADAKPGFPRIDLSKTETDTRILHLLNRFTFGATLEEIAQVRAMGSRGLERWFEDQLHPDDLRPTSQDVYLETQIAALPALNLPVDQLLGTFPSGAVIRQAANGKIPVPQDPLLYAIYRRHIGLYQDKQAKKAEAEKTSDNAAPNPEKNGAMNGGEMTATKATEGMVAESMPMPSAGPAVATTYPTATRSADAGRPSYSDLLMKGVLALPPAERVPRVLRMQPVEYEQFHSALKGPQRQELLKGLNPQDRELLTDFENPTKTVVEELETQRLLHDIYSSHQLQEVMTTFWLNHFNVFLHKNEETPYYLVSYERDVIRPNALGNFEDLLVATAESPAMLLYLDNASSTGPASEAAAKQMQREKRTAIGKPAKAAPGLNENYARELMELHTLGVNGGYTQQDVTEVAKVFTGWTVDRPQLGGDFKYDDSRHEPGTKLVLGHKIKEHGMKEGLQLLHILATSPATAHFISQELAVAFVSDKPPAALIDRMAKSFEKNDGEISEVLRTMVRSPEFWAAETYQAKVKTPLEYVVSAARASGAEIVSPQPLINALNQMGMPLYGCVPPTGYSLKADAWVSTGELVDRMNFALSLATNRMPGIKSQWNTSNQLQVTPAQSEQDLEARLVPGGISDKTRAAVLEQAQSDRPVQALTPIAGLDNSEGNRKTDQEQDRARQDKTGQDKAVPDKAAQGSVQAAKPAAALASAQEKQSAQIAGLLLGSPEFQRR